MNENPGANTEIFNKEELLERLCGDEEILEEIMEVYFSDTPRQLEILTTALDEGDEELVYRQAHTIKGASGNVAAVEMREIAFKLEMAGRSGDLIRAEELLPELRAAFGRIQDLLRS